METKTITVDELKSKVANKEPFLILDVRDESKFQAGTLILDGISTQNVPYVLMKEDQSHAAEQLLSKDLPIITLCTSGNKAKKAAALLQEKGYSCAPLEGGLTAWNGIIKGE